jgi:hypothetical protein
MRRITITLAAALMLLGFGPASALARHHHHHRGRHHHRHARIERFGDWSNAPASNAADNAGTVQSFSGGMLTIMLADGSSVSGAVTDETQLECTAPDQSQTMHEDGDSGSGDQSGDPSGDQSGDQTGENQTAGMEDQNATEDQNENEAEDQNDNEDQNTCTTANLAPGTVVRDAELRISSAGAVWKELELQS